MKVEIFRSLIDEYPSKEIFSKVLKFSTQERGTDHHVYTSICRGLGHYLNKS